MVELKDKYVLKEKEFIDIPKDSLVATLTWKQAIDLDLYAFYAMKDGRKGQVYYANRNRCSEEYPPHISLDQDAGVGDVGGDNKETIRIKTLDAVDHILIAANIFDKPNAIFASFDGGVTVNSLNKEFYVQLSSKERGNWCIIAHLENVDTPYLSNVNLTIQKKPDIDTFLMDGYSGQEPAKKGFFSRLFGN